jgi:hypothetical protein
MYYNLICILYALLYGQNFILVKSGCYIIMSRLLGRVISELVLMLLNLDFEIDRSGMNLGRFFNDNHIPTRAKYYPHSNSCLC